ncbi:PepSY domain-containing protein [Enterococcus pallens]
MLTLAAMSTLGVLLAGCKPNRTNLESHSTSESSMSTVNSQSTDTANSSDIKNTNTSEEFAISLSEAINSYQKQYPDTDITGIDINNKFGNYYYEITGVDNNTEYEVDVNVTTGEFRLDREEALDHDEKNGVERKQEKLDLDNLLSLSEINSITLKEADGIIEEWSLEKELSTTYWEISVRNEHQEISVLIDAQSGNVLETEVDD